MAGKNENLHKAKTAKQDEFCMSSSQKLLNFRLDEGNDIEAEMNAYVEYNPGIFRGKTVLLPCDNPELSLKELVSTGKDIITILRNNIFTHMDINSVCALGGVA